MHAYGPQAYPPDAKFGVIAFGTTALTSNVVGGIVIYRLVEEKVGISLNHQFGFDKAWEDKIMAMSGDIKDPVNEVYRNRPDTMVPPSFKISQPVASCNDTGCGTFTFRDKAHLNKPDKIPVAYQPELTFYDALLETTEPWWLLHR